MQNSDKMVEKPPFSFARKTKDRYTSCVKFALFEFWILQFKNKAYWNATPKHKTVNQILQFHKISFLWQFIYPWIPNAFFSICRQFSARFEYILNLWERKLSKKSN